MATRVWRLCAAVAMVVAMTACGSSSPTSPSTGNTGGTGGTGGGGTGGGGTGGNGTTITITTSGVSPKTLTVPAGTRVTFVNNDTRPHDMNSNPHPEHTDCPAINDVGFIQAGQTKLTGNLTVVRTCGFHDHDQPTNTALQGSIVIQ
jgi:plastocyanin